MQRKSIRRVLVTSTITIVITVFLFFITQQITDYLKKREIQEIQDNIAIVNDCVSLVQQLENDFKAYVETGASEYAITANQCNDAINNIIEYHPEVFQTADQVILFSRSVAQIAFALNTILHDRLYNNLDKTEAFTAIQLADTGFQFLTKATHSLLVEYLSYTSDKIKKIVKSVVQAVPCPVTVKIRSGWDEKSINAKLVAKICEEAGASAITIHGRTRKQGYSGNVDLDIIKEVKESVNIPVIANGDIKDIESAKKMLEYTKCDAIMIGRATLGNPWLIKKLVTYFEENIILPDPTYEEKINMALKHLSYLTDLKNEKVAILEIRSHMAWYLKGLKDSGPIKNAINQAKTIEEIKKILNNYLNYLKNSIK